MNGGTMIRMLIKASAKMMFQTLLIPTGAILPNGDYSVRATVILMTPME